MCRAEGRRLDRVKYRHARTHDAAKSHTRVLNAAQHNAHGPKHSIVPKPWHTHNTPNPPHSNISRQVGVSWVGVGLKHTLVATKLGDVFAFGDNRKGPSICPHGWIAGVGGWMDGGWQEYD